MSAVRFQQDRKLDNKKEQISEVTMVHFEYRIGWKKINVEREIYVGRTGYCLFNNNKKRSSVSFSEIGIVTFGLANGQTPCWQMVDYGDIEEKALLKFMRALEDYKNEKLKILNLIPV